MKFSIFLLISNGSVEQKLSGHHGGCYNITEAQAIMTELRNIQKSLSSGEKEKAELMQSLAQLKDELTRLQLCEGSPEASTLSLPQEKLSTASQTDLSGELVPIGTRLAEMARMRLQYDEARKRIQHIQQQLRKATRINCCSSRRKNNCSAS